MACLTCTSRVIRLLIHSSSLSSLAQSSLRRPLPHINPRLQSRFPQTRSGSSISTAHLVSEQLTDDEKRNTTITGEIRLASEKERLVGYHYQPPPEPVAPDRFEPGIGISAEESEESKERRSREVEDQRRSFEEDEEEIGLPIIGRLGSVDEEGGQDFFVTPAEIGPPRQRVSGNVRDVARGEQKKKDKKTKKRLREREREGTFVKDGSVALADVGLKEKISSKRVWEEKENLAPRYQNSMIEIDREIFRPNGSKYRDKWDLPEVENPEKERRSPTGPRNSKLQEHVSNTPHRDLETWRIQKAALQRKFDGKSWNPAKRLSPETVQGIKALNRNHPEYTAPILAEVFEVSSEAMRRILKSKWQPNLKEKDSRNTRWVRRGNSVWNRWAEQGYVQMRRVRRETPGRMAEEMVRQQMQFEEKAFRKFKKSREDHE